MAELPFDDDVMTLIMGLGEPEKPGQHGRTMIPAPEQNAIDFATQIRDLCEEFLLSMGKAKEEEKKPQEEDQQEAPETPEPESE